MKQVIYAWNYLEWGGAQIHLLAILKEVRKETRVLVVLPEDSDRQFLKYLEDEGVECQLFKCLREGNESAGLLGKLKTHWLKLKNEYLMLKQLSRHNLSESLVHVELSPQQSLLALLWLAGRTRVFITWHNALPAVSRWRTLLWKIKFKIILSFKNFNAFCSNEHAKNYFKQYYPPSRADRIKVTYTSINPPEIDVILHEKTDRTALLKRYDLPADKFLVLCVGQFIDRKGRWTFLEAARQINQQTGEIIFIWVSNSRPDEADLKKAEEFGLNGNFRLLMSDEVGPTRDDLFRFFRTADVFTLPSFVEGLPIALLEAMALEIPSVSTNVFAIPEAVKHLETGMLIEAGDAEALAESILRIKDDEQLRKKLSREGRRYVLRHFDEREAARTAIESYKEAESSTDGRN